MAAIFSGFVWAQPPTPAPAGKPAPGQQDAKKTATPATQPVSDQAKARSQMEESIARQKESIRKQTGAASADTFFTVEWTGPPTVQLPPVADCAPLPDTESEQLIAVAATAQKLDPALIRAVIRQESGFRPCAYSPKGAMGLMQLMPDTADHFNVKDPFNSPQNVMAGAKYLKQLMEHFKGDLKLTLAAYNAGPGKVDGDPPAVPDIPETQDYVDQILKALGETAPKAQETQK